MAASTPTSTALQIPLELLGEYAKDIQALPTALLAQWLCERYVQSHITPATSSNSLSFATIPSAAAAAQPAVLNSSRQGRSGETSIAKLLEQQYTITNTSSRGQSGDMHLQHQSQPGIVLVEVKNYTTSVPSAELEKFYRDLECNRQLVGAVFVSNQRIVSHHPLFQYSADPLPHVIVVSMVPEVIRMSVELVWQMAAVQRLRGRQDMNRINRRINKLSEELNSIGQIVLHFDALESQLHQGFIGLRGKLVLLEHHCRQIVRSIHNQIDLTAAATAADPVLDAATALVNIAAGGQSLLATDSEHRLWLAELLAPLGDGTVNAGTSTITWASGYTVRFSLLKTKTTVHFTPPTGPGNVNVIVPKYCSYSGGELHLEVDKKAPRTYSVTRLQTDLGIVNGSTAGQAESLEGGSPLLPIH